MIHFFRCHFLTFLFLLIVFFDQIFVCSLILSGTEVTKGIKQYEAIFFSVLVFAAIFFNLMNGKLMKNDLRSIFVVSVLILLYYLTHFFYGPPPDGYMSQLLVMGSECLPAAYVGSRIAKKGLNNLFYYFSIIIIFTTILLSTIGLKYATVNELVTGDDSGLNYQTMSYFMAFSFSYCLYLLFFHKLDSCFYYKFIRISLVICSLICFVFCILSGGRGGLYFMLAFSLFFLMICIKHKIITARVFILISFAAFGAILCLIYYFDALNSSGLDRVFSRFANFDTRSELYDMAINAFYDSPIYGNGLGSVWWTVGYYSHNIFLDILSETGLIGFLVFSLIAIKTIKILIASSYNNKLSILFLIILLGSLFRGLVSGYWLGTMNIFMCCSYAFGLSRRRFESVKVDGLS